MTGKTPFQGDGSKMSFGLPSSESILPAGKQKAYKWTDADGLTHYSSEPPPEGLSGELLHVNPDTNLVQGLKPSIKTKDPEPPIAPPQPVMPQGNIYNPDTIRKLIDDAKDIQKTMNERNEQLEEQY